jgi:hypothetical protein
VPVGFLEVKGDSALGDKVFDNALSDELIPCESHFYIQWERWIICGGDGDKM